MIPVKTIKIDESINLRQIIPMDAEDVFDLIDRERDYLGQWLPFVAQTLSVDDSISFINAINKAAEEKDICVFTIRKDESCIGVIGLKATDFENHKTEIGYWLSEKQQGQGIITRSVEALCQRAFTKMDINRIQIKCAVGNMRSKAIPQRLGFTLEGIERDGELMSNGKYVDLEIYSLLRRDKI